MEYREIIRILNNIEDNIAVDDIKYDGLKIWPLIRLEIWKELNDTTEKELTVKYPATRYFYRIIRKVIDYFTYIILQKEKKYNKTLAVFLIGKYERTVKVDGKYYSRFSNSLQNILTNLGITSSTLDLSSKKTPVWGKTYFIDKQLRITPLKIKFYQLIKLMTNKRNRINGWKNFEDYLNSKFPSLKINKKNVIKNAEAILSYEIIFEKILKKIRPRLCFLECYYHPTAMAYIRACRNLGIKTVEIQHGEQHAMYRNWSKIPSEGYDTMPSLWWCWGEESAREINKWSKCVHPEHLAFVGGNPWISSLLESTPKNNESSGHNVLVAVPSKEYPLDHLLKAIKDSPVYIYWRISIHPMRLRDGVFMDKLKNNLYKTGNKNIYIQKESGPSFYEMLNMSDFLITPWSTTAYEALVFKVHPIIIDDSSKDIFAHYIQEKLFSMALTAEEILNILQKEKSEINFKEHVPYMEIDRTKMEHTLSTLIKGENLVQ